MGERFKGFKRWIFVGALLLAALLAAACFYWRYDILRTTLDPKIPFQAYRPPAAPDYGRDEAWALLPRDPAARPPADRPVDVFFVHPTSFDGGRDWNAPIDQVRAARDLSRVMLPNYAGPFARVGRIFAPRYRQASLYTFLTLRDDARDARRFAYGDVRDAFRLYVSRYSQDRPLVLVGVEQGGTLLSRLVTEEVATHPELLARLAGVYLIETVVPAADYGPGALVPACERRDQAGCVVAYASLQDGDFPKAQELINRSLVWDEAEQLVELQGRAPLCVNPLTGGLGTERVPARLNLGAANATGLEWGSRPAFLKRQVWAQCDGGLLHTGRSKSTSLRPTGSWTDRRKVPGYNLFFADIEADARTRVSTLLGRPAYGAPKAASPE
ncbi:hypothetical protein CSW58_08575 [Caulobacter sp. B11]|uniref:DUF3089 domain-containing protein n=1 Tax=Caulobacter sp. B11 TaxID=2048899 RepID=UPI000C12A41F|nr:DUF3089 domain-containing protein [Caulobacter sp. B11]PHY13018.1 hypothetical protein CSW58_08575 [Caulobacter sp. B11]